LYTSSALPLLRLTSTYQALVSMVAADAAGAFTTVNTPTASVVSAAAAAASHRRRRSWGGFTYPPGI
jgi:hypothetical protein